MPIDPAIKHVAESEVWHYFGRNNSIPFLNTISCNCPHSGDTGHFAQALSVFAFMQLSLEQLSEIFGGCCAFSYDQLGGCSAFNDDGWKKLARLSQKVIHFVHCHGEPQGMIRAAYYPDGRMELINPDT